MVGFNFLYKSQDVIKFDKWNNKTRYISFSRILGNSEKMVLRFLIVGSGQ